MTEKSGATKSKVQMADLSAPLVFEYVWLDTRDLSLPFYYRFTGPLTTAWQNSAITLPASLSAVPDGWNVGVALRAHALKAWNDMVKSNEPNFVDTAHTEWKQLRRDTLELRECVIMPKELS